MEKQMYRMYLTHQKTRRSVRWWCERVVVTMLRSHDCYSRGDTPPVAQKLNISFKQHSPIVFMLFFFTKYCSNRHNKPLILSVYQSKTNYIFIFFLLFLCLTCVVITTLLKQKPIFIIENGTRSSLILFY